MLIHGEADLCQLTRLLVDCLPWNLAISQLFLKLSLKTKIHRTRITGGWMGRVFFVFLPSRIKNTENNPVCPLNHNYLIM